MCIENKSIDLDASPDEYLKFFRIKTPKNNMNNFPKVGDKLKFKTIPEFFYPCYTCMRERAQKILEKDKSYTVSHVEVYSSWCQVWLEEIGNGENQGFNLTFFEQL